MGKIIECRNCGKLKEHSSKGLCSGCYTWERRIQHPYKTDKKYLCNVCGVSSQNSYHMIGELRVCEKCIRKQYPELADIYINKVRKYARRKRADNVNIEWLTNMLGKV